MKLAVMALTALLVLSQSQAKTIATAHSQDSRKHSVSKTQTPMKSALVRAIPKYKRQALAIELDLDDNDDPAGSDELDLHVAYRRPALVNDSTDESTDVSDYVSVRLAVARAKAMQAFRQKALTSQA